MTLRLAGVAAVLAQVAHILSAIAAVAAKITNVAPQVARVSTTLSDILATLLTGFVVPDLASIASQLAAILHDLALVAMELAIVAPDLSPVRAQLVRFVMVDPRMQRASVRVIGILCVREGRTSNEQGRGDRSHSEIAHRIPQRQYPALAVVTCAAHTTFAARRTLRRVRGTALPANSSPMSHPAAHSPGPP